MINIHRELILNNLKTQMLLQVHGRMCLIISHGGRRGPRIVEEGMKKRNSTRGAIVVEIGLGQLVEAHNAIRVSRGVRVASGKIRSSTLCILMYSLAKRWAAP